VAQKPDGKRPSDRITFTRGAAERISEVVRTVELGNRDGQPLRFQKVQGGDAGKVFRICTFTGTWAISESKTLTFKYQTTTPNTVMATNLFAAVGAANTATSTPCAIAREGTAWFLIAARCP
jgi:hypothetical protein